MQKENIQKIYEKAELFDKSKFQRETIKSSIHTVLEGFGEDPSREGLQNTPERVARMYEELLSGYWTDPIELLNEAIFEESYDEMVIVRDIEFYSLCEHHMLPFIGRAHVAYIPNGKIIGLSKIPRIVDMFSKRLQVQERLTNQIADLINELLEPQGVAVVMEAAHLCSMVRGVKKHDSRMITSCMRGVFKKNMSTRMEFLTNIGRGEKPLSF
ncbi:MAG: GTP cyclohydrolase I FolE [Anaerolineaceae bacterium]|nr:GTP cyclohydrolase I FolE [Anaerolineaceae bacterium]